MSTNMTKGEQRVRITFNPSGDNFVNQVKKDAANLIDKMEGYKNDLLATNQYTVDPSYFSEQLAWIELAQRAAEEAAMWSVKALTYELPTKA